MSILLATLEQQTRALDERARLATVLLEPPHDSPLLEIEAEWQREFEKCLAAYDRDEAPIYVAEKVFAAAKFLCK